MPKKQEVKEGDIFNSWTVVKEVEPYKKYYRRFLCQNKKGTQKIVRLCHLNSGNSKGTYASKKTHGETKTPLYNAWLNMKTRCNNKNRKDWNRYGGRGIKICERWKSYKNFKTDMSPTYKPGMTLERKDNNKGYNKKNCEWATRKKQSRNRSSTRRYQWRGKERSMKEIAEITNTNYWTLRWRLDKGIPLKKAVNENNSSK